MSADAGLDPSATPPSAPPPRHRLRLAGLLLATALLAACSRGDAPAEAPDAARELSAGAQTDGLVSDGESARRIAAHRLTLERVERWFLAQEELEALVADDPALESRIRGDAARAGGDQAIERAAARLEREPVVRDAIRDGGLSVREFVLTGLALHQALLASGPGAPARLRQLAARNVRFVSENADVLQRYADQAPRYLAVEQPPPDTFYYDYMSGVDTIVYDAVTDSAAADPLVDSLLTVDSMAVTDSVVRLDPIIRARTDSARAAARRDSLARRPPPDSAALPAPEPPRPPSPPPPPPA